jgi:hypothetical protein
MQLPEVLEYQGRWYSLHTLPLEAYLAKLPERPAFYATPTCLDRMYVAKWKIEGDSLFLVALHAHDREGNCIALDDLFPGATAPIRANWYSGILRCPLGKRLKAIPFGFDSIYEADQLFLIEEGRVVSIERRANPIPPREQGEADIPAFLRTPQGRGPS